MVISVADRWPGGPGPNPATAHQLPTTPLPGATPSGTGKAGSTGNGAGNDGTANDGAANRGAGNGGAGNDGAGNPGAGSGGTTTPANGAPGDVPGTSGQASPLSVETAPSTTNPPTQESTAERIQTQGGVVMARCSGSIATLTSWAPADGYVVGKALAPGPSKNAAIRFVSATEKVVVRVGCKKGVVDSQIVIKPAAAAD
jgi:hypothetical protein